MIKEHIQNMGCIVLAGVSSSVGKTTVAMGIMDALRRRHLTVQPFKVGPDYIDPSYHASICGRPCRNLDSWMLSLPALLELYHRAMQGAQVAVVEGVMGLFDGYSRDSESGSTAQVARWLQAPVILVVDVSHAARSAAATVLGFRHFDPDLALAGVILNFVASPGHYHAVTSAIEKEAGLPVLGYLYKRGEISIPQRHLGLVPTAEGWSMQGFRERLAEAVEANFDMDVIYALAQRQQAPPYPTPILFPPQTMVLKTSLAVAQDEAFNFYYQDNLDLLEAWGARLLPFSPLRDRSLPHEAQGLYLGGGFPELYAEGISANKSLMDNIRRAAQSGMPIYAECGGLMYLSQGIKDFQGRDYPMVGLVPSVTIMGRERLSLGYAEVEACRPNPLMRLGERARGHEFHYSNWAGTPDQAAYTIINQDRRHEGYIRGNLLASYIHLHFGSNPRLAPRFAASLQAGGG